MATPNSYPEGTELTENFTYEWTKEGGEVPVKIIEGNFNEINTRYLAEKVAGSAYGTSNLASIGYESNRGRARLIMRYVRENQDIEELYAVDVLRDIALAPYFQTLSNAEVLAVRTVFNNQTAEDDAWSALQKTLYKHLIFGVESYIDKQFILRTSTFTSSAKEVAADFSALNTVVTAPTLSSNMTRLIASLPTGEWLQGPTSAEHLGRGRWRIENEVQWAKKWSVIYGGTLFALGEGE